MKPKMFWSMLLVLALAATLLVWLSPIAQGSGALAPKFTRCVNPGGTSGCYASIQAAINDSLYGDNIDVWSGTYTEHVTMTNGVSIYGQGSLSTTINGNFSAPRPVVFFPSGIDAKTVLSGVQVTHGGTGDPNNFLEPDGGGIAIIQSSPQIINSWAYSNTGHSGGGVAVMGGSPTFVNVPAWNNRAVWGGGFFIRGDGNPIDNSSVTMTGNPAEVGNGTVFWDSADNGGGIYIDEYTYGVTVTISGLRMWWNTAFGGAGLYIHGGPRRITLQANDISANGAIEGSGGGIYADAASNLQISNNAIDLNSATGNGGGVFWYRSFGLLQNNLLFGNQGTNVSSNGGGAYVIDSSTQMTINGNWFEANSTGELGAGGGLCITNDATALINANVFLTNTAYSGGAVHVDWGHAVTLTNNIAAHNVVSANQTGGFRLWSVPSQPYRIVNNTIAQNLGDGVNFQYTDGIVIFNNIVYGNQGYGIHRADASTYDADYNDLFGNSVPGVCGPHCLSIDPAFIGSGNMLNYYHLKPTSPVYNTGSLGYAPPFDIDSEARVVCASMGADQIGCNRLFLPLIVK